jgi:hypothetical protein
LRRRGARLAAHGATSWMVAGCEAAPARCLASRWLVGQERGMT